MGRPVRDRVRRILVPMGHVNSIEDVCQQFWMHLWKVGPNYWNPRGVNLIAGQIVLKWLRKHKRPPFESIIDRIDEPENIEPHEFQGRNFFKLPRDTSELFPDVSKITLALRRLPGEQRAVFSFRFQMEAHEELTFREIGQRLGISTGQAVCLFYWARKNLQTILGER
jgi:RNA polymerase sigma factor (sigma-70 family)